MARSGFYIKIWKQIQLFLLLPLILRVTTYSYKRTLYEPTFQNTPRNITVHRNELARLQCRIKHLGPKQVAWRKVSMDYPLTVGIVTFDPKEDIAVRYKDLKDQAEGLSQWDLIIKRAQPRHSGTYECQISAQNVYTHYVYLKVLDTPLELKPAISLDGTTFVNIHETIKLTCNATGGTRAPSNVDWFFDGHRIRGRDSRWGKRLHITDRVPDVPGRTLISELTIQKSVFGDKGKYVCRSVAGGDSRTIGLEVSVLNTEKDHEKRDDKNENSPVSSQHLESTGPSFSYNGYFIYFVMLATILI